MKRVALFLALVVSPAYLFAQWHGSIPPDSLSVQGYLTDDVGAPINSLTNITFKLYKGSSEIWSQTKTGVQVTNGVFNIFLGGVNGESLNSIAFDEPIKLGVTVGTDAEMIPRTPLASSAYALGLRGLHAVYAEHLTDRGINLIGGARNNYIEANVVGGTIGGGGGWPSGNAAPDSIKGSWGTIAGGTGNTAGSSAFVGGGTNNKARSNNATIGGGASNKATSDFTTIGGGFVNEASAIYATVGGGVLNEASATHATVGGGNTNHAAGDNATVGGGTHNSSGTRATVGGGDSNHANADLATVGGGGGNTAGGQNATIGGGSGNQAGGRYATIPGGFANQANGGYAFAAGQGAYANHSGSFVWADSAANDLAFPFSSTDENQFLIRASGGVGIGTNAPARMVHISGENAVLRIDRDQGFGGASILLNQYAPGAPATPWNSFVLVSSATGSGVGAFEIRDLGTAVTGSGALRMKIDDSGNVGIGTSSPVEKLHVAGDIYTRGHLYLHAYEGDGSSGTAFVQARDKSGTTSIGMNLRTQLSGVVQEAVQIAANGDVHVLGNLSKGGGSFKIDHPLDPENKYLYHSFVESPDMMNVYNGNVVLDDKGEATVQLPSYFEALNRDFRYQLTSIGRFAPIYVASEISDGRFTVAGGEPGMKVSWQVTGIRHDPYAEQYRIAVEVDKPAVERGTYLHPDLYRSSKGADMP